MKQPLVSIIMVTYNSARLLHDCLDPVRERIATGDFELILVDNNSRDNPQSELDSMEMPHTFIQTGGNPGFAVAVNIGVREARGRHILLLNPDVTFPPNIIDLLAHRLDADASIGAIAPVLETPGIQTANGGSQPTLIPMIAHSTGVARHLRHKRPLLGHYAYEDGIGTSMLDVEWLSGGFLMLAPSVTRSGALLSERWFMYAEDLDLSRWISQHGLRLVLCGDIRARHAIGASSSTASKEIRTMWIENLRDYYEQAYARHLAARLSWRVIVAAGYAARAIVAGATRNDRRRALSAYARAVLRANGETSSAIRSEITPKSAPHSRRD